MKFFRKGETTCSISANLSSLSRFRARAPTEKGRSSFLILADRYTTRRLPGTNIFIDHDTGPARMALIHLCLQFMFCDGLATTGSCRYKLKHSLIPREPDSSRKRATRRRDTTRRPFHTPGRHSAGLNREGRKKLASPTLQHPSLTVSRLTDRKSRPRQSRRRRRPPLLETFPA